MSKLTCRCWPCSHQALKIISYLPSLGNSMGKLSCSELPQSCVAVFVLQKPYFIDDFHSFIYTLNLVILFPTTIFVLSSVLHFSGLSSLRREWELNLQVAEFTDSKMNLAVYEDFTCRIKSFFRKESCKLIMLFSCQTFCKKATYFHAEKLYLSSSHLYLQNMLAMVFKELKVLLLRNVELIFCQDYYTSGKIFSLWL